MDLGVGVGAEAAASSIIAYLSEVGPSAAVTLFVFGFFEFIIL
jgi:hypothetical protein